MGPPMRLIDLSAPISSDPPEVPELLRTEVAYEDHAAGAEAIRALLGVEPELLRDREGWAVETFTRLGTHSTTHVDAPWHYNSQDRGLPRADDRRAAAGVVLRARGDASTPPIARTASR